VNDTPEASGDPRPAPITAGLQPERLLRTLERHRVAFVVIGGFALAPHGYIRATKDIDIVPEQTRENLARLAVALRDLDAQADLADIGAKELGLAPDEEGLMGGGNWVLRTRFGRLDVMQTVPGLRDYQHLRAGAVEVAGVLYAGYEELIAMKAASGREQDLRDIGALEAARGTD
jgi:hypothetical protein